MIEYWRNKLERDAKKCYPHMLHGIQKKNKSVDCGNVSVDGIQAAYFAIYNDHPELFYMSSSPKFTKTECGVAGWEGFLTSCSVDTTPIYTDKEIQDCEKSIENTKAIIKGKITSGTTDEEKVIIVAEYLVCNTVYEIDNRYNQNAASALCYGKSQCSGITKAFKLLMDYLGIYCISISGKAVDECGNIDSHAWNVIKISENYYHVDVTFMLGANMNKSQPIIDMYLFYDDDSIAQNHTWDRTQVPQCTDKTKKLNDLEKNKFILQRQNHTGAIAHSRQVCKSYSTISQLRTDLQDAMRHKNKSVEFYLNIGLNSPNDIIGVVRNAVKMVATKEAINCSFTVSVSQNKLVNIQINY